MILTPGQERTRIAFKRWLLEGASQVFTLLGPAGTGKSTIAPFLRELVRGPVANVTPTNKAAKVLRDKGCPDAQTLFRLMYFPVLDAEGNLIGCQKKTREVCDELGFDGPWNYRLILIDEASMVSEAQMRDLLAFGVRVLLVGDNFQLPPVSGGVSRFMTEPPDALLTEITRQAAESPIIRIATEIREGRNPPMLRGGDVNVYFERDVTPEILRSVLEADQIIVGRNETRAKINKNARAMLGFVGHEPHAGEKLISLKNEDGLCNGEILRVTHDTETARGPDWLMSLRMENDDGERIERLLNIGALEEAGLHDEQAHFAYSYAITVHKAQGSQWDHVAVYDEAYAWAGDDHEMARRWQYTAVTRAERALTVVIPRANRIYYGTPRPNGSSQRRSTRVSCDITQVDLEGDYRREIPGVAARCTRCGHVTESYGTSDASVRRCLATMRAACPRGQSNYYVAGEGA